MDISLLFDIFTNIYWLNIVYFSSFQFSILFTELTSAGPVFVELFLTSNTPTYKKFSSQYNEVLDVFIVSPFLFVRNLEINVLNETLVETTIC